MCQLAGGLDIEVYVKYRGFHEDLIFDHLTGELVSNQFALDLGLPAAEPCLVDVTEDFLEVIPDCGDGMAIKNAFGHSDGVAFGSVAFRSVRRWSAENLVHKGQLEQAAKLYLFDTIVENTDRSVGNSNLLVSGHDFKVIDFGHSFQRFHDGSEDDCGPLPWQTNGISNHYAGDMQHVLFNGLKDVQESTVDDFTTKLADLSDTVIENYVTNVPIEWGQECACKIVDYLLDARANAELFSIKAKEVIACSAR